MWFLTFIGGAVLATLGVVIVVNLIAMGIEQVRDAGRRIHHTLAV